MLDTEKTESLLRLSLPIGMLEKNSDNPNRMSARSFDLLVDNIQRTGLTDAILVRPVDLQQVQQIADYGPANLKSNLESVDAKFRIVGGHHRYDAASYLGFDEVPVTVIMDPDFDDEQEQYQLVRMNVIKGKMDPQAFINLYSKLSAKHSDEILQDSFGFADEADFKKLIAQTAKSLPKELQSKFKDAAAEIKTIDDLSKVLNHLFTKYGNSVPYGYMVLDQGGQKHLWLRSTKKTFDALDLIGDFCIEQSVTMDAVIGGVVRAIANGECSDLMEKIVSAAPKVILPTGIKLMPTEDNIDAQMALKEE